MSNRTKGNTKPSNSDRASRLLTSNEFVSFSQASRSLPSIYGTNQNESVSAFDCAISIDFQNIFKHMVKKDNKTRYKALEDFIEMCVKKEKDEVLKIARYWFKIYGKLANDIEWNVRYLAHKTQQQFVLLFERNIIVQIIESSSTSVLTQEENENLSAEVRSQNLITMPAIIWIACYDAYRQPFESARRAFKCLYRNEKHVMEFLFKHHETITNYCLYIIFKKVPIKEFFNIELPPELSITFEEHKQVICLLGFSSLVNEFLCSYLKFEKAGETDSQSELLNCIKQVFDRINNEFVKCKEFKNSSIITVDEEKEQLKKEMTNIDESNKSKKKLKRDMKINDSKKDESVNKCKFWDHFSSATSNYVKKGLFQMLNSLVRLTSFLSKRQNDEEKSYVEGYNDNKLWFKIYKKELLQIIFKSFTSEIYEIRGLAWLLGSHLLLNNKIYDPWSTINCDEWLDKTLKPFVLNGFKTPGTTINFGFCRIGMKNYGLLFEEIQRTKYIHFSALQLIKDDYPESDIILKINAISLFIDKLNKCNKSKYQIFDLFLTNIFNGFDNVTTSSDMDIMVELYFNMCFTMMKQCFGSFEKNKISEGAQNMIITITKHIGQLLKKALEDEKNLLMNSQTFLNHLLFTHHIKQYYLDLLKNETKYDLEILENSYLEYTFQMITIYDEIVKLNKNQLPLCRFFTESFFKSDHYFSYKYYWDSKNVNYEQGILDVFKGELTRYTERAQFDSIVENFNKPRCDPEDSIFGYVIVNSKYNNFVQPTVSFSLSEIFPNFTRHIVTRAIDMINLIDSIFNQNFIEDLEETFILFSHLIYLMNSASPETIIDIDNELNYPIRKYLVDWIHKIYVICDKLHEDHSGKENELIKKYKKHAFIAAKCLDLFVIIYSSRDYSLLTIEQQLMSQLNPFGFCLFIRHIEKLYFLVHAERYKSIILTLFALLKFYSTNDFRRALLQQLKIMFDDCKNKTFEGTIMTELIKCITSRNIIDRATFKLISDFINLISEKFLEMSNEILVEHVFYASLPLMIKNLYILLLRGPDRLDELENFKTDIIKNINNIYQKLYSLLYWDELKDPSINKSILLNFECFVREVDEFSNETLCVMFNNYSNYSPLIAQISALKINFFIEKIIFNSKTPVKTLCAKKLILNLLSLLISKHLYLMEERLSYEEIETSFHIVFYVPDHLKETFEEKSLIFEKKNDFSNLFNLYIEDDLINQIYQFIYAQENQILHQNDIDKFKLALTHLDNTQFWEMNIMIANILKMFCTSIYIDSELKSLLPHDLSIDAWIQQVLNLNHNQSFFVVLKRLLKNFYLLQNFTFILNYFDDSAKIENGNKIVECKSLKTKLRTILHDFCLELIPILEMILKYLQTTLYAEDLLFEYLLFLSETYNHSVNLPLFNRCLNEYHKKVIWTIEFKECKRRPKEFPWIELVNTTDIDIIINAIKEATESITYNEIENEIEVKKMKSFSELPPETIQKFLIILNISLKKLPQFKLETSMIDLIQQLARSDFASFFKTNYFPDISDKEYQIYWFTSHVIAQSVPMMEFFGLEEFKMFILIYKQWIQSLFTLHENISFDKVMLNTQILKSLHTFIQATQIWMSKHQESLEIVECLKNFFAYHLYNILLPLFVTLSECLEKESLCKKFFHQLINVILCLDKECLKDISMLEINQSLLIYKEDSVEEQRIRSLQTEMTLSPLNYLSIDNIYYEYILEHVTPLLLKDDYQTIFCAYHLISLTINSVNWRTNLELNNNSNLCEVNTDLTLSGLDSFNEGHYCLPPKILVCLLEQFKTISIQSLNLRGVYAYLLTWTIYLQLIARFSYKGSETQIRLDLINYLIEKNLHSQLCDNLFFLMHNSNYSRNIKTDYFEELAKTIMNGQTIKDIIDKLNCLEDSQKLWTFIESDKLKMPRLAFFVYYQALCYIPNVIRSWFNSLKYPQQEFIDKVSRKFLTHLLIHKELDIITTADRNQFGNINIKFSKKTQEISAIYSLKEISFGIKFDFPNNFPLKPVSIECFNKSGVSEEVCRKWLQTLTKFFNKLNCSILEGIIMIKPNMDKFFEGIEECMICLFVLYGAIGQLPRFKCPQCKKKFHTNCIRKWFQTHHSPTCPQCKFEFQ